MNSKMTIGDIFNVDCFDQLWGNANRPYVSVHVNDFGGFEEQQIAFREISVKSGIFAKNRREIWHFGKKR